MLMNENPGLIATLLHALDQPDPRQPLEDLFQRVMSSGCSPESAPDYREFLDVMATIERHQIRRDSRALVAAAFSMLLQGTKASLQATRFSRWWEKYGSLTKSMTQVGRRKTELDLVVRAGERLLVHFPLPRGPFEQTVHDLQPGPYQIGTETGWRLWTGELSEKDLLLGATERRRPLRLAAQDAPARPDSTRIFSLGETPLCVAVFPGIESGSIRIFRRMENGREILS